MLQNTKFGDMIGEVYSSNFEIPNKAPTLFKVHL